MRKALLVCGILSSLANLPTPLLGVWGRIMIGVFLLWVVALAVTLLWRSRSHGGTIARVKATTRVAGNVLA